MNPNRLSQNCPLCSGEAAAEYLMSQSLFTSPRYILSSSHTAIAANGQSQACDIMEWTSFLGRYLDGTF